jgi:hypothetical protein
VRVQAVSSPDPYTIHDIVPMGPILLGTCFKSLVLVQYNVPPIGSTQPWPLQGWDVDLRVESASWGGGDLGILYPGRIGDCILRGEGFENVVTALGLVVNGMRQHVGLAGG